MNNKNLTYPRYFLFTLILVTLLSSHLPTASAQEPEGPTEPPPEEVSCGSIITPWESIKIEDCDNPFGGVVESIPGLTFGDAGIVPYSDISVSENEWGVFSINPFFDYGGDLYQKIGEDFLYIRNINLSNSYTVLRSGLYTDAQIEQLENKFFYDVKGEGTNWRAYERQNPENNIPDYAILMINEFEKKYAPLAHIFTTGDYVFVLESKIGGPSQSFLDKVQDFIIPKAYANDLGLPSVIPFTVNGGTIVTPPEPVGASSVLFLPGMQASRLYKEGASNSVDRLWEPNGNQDVSQLGMTEAGESINEVYTKEIIREAFGVVSIYNSFYLFMDNLVATGTIKAWKPFAYDWRYDVFNIVSEGTKYENERRYLQSELMNLASNSFSGKVTIVAHSNGGLLVKALLVENPELAELVDKIIFLGSPQLGTPKAVGALLHGYDQKKLGGLLVSDATSRSAMENMPGAYGLLPSQAYFSSRPDLVISFDASETTSSFRLAYGNAINTESELRDFMSAVDGRPAAVSINEASTVNEGMLDSAFSLHSSKLDSWVAPSTIEVTEIVGIGLDTESGFEYQEFTERICSDPDIFGTEICESKKLYKPVPWITQYGDETVVGSSAEGYIGNKEVYFADLFATNITHASLMESVNIQSLLSNLLRGVNRNIVTIQSIYNEPPSYGNNRSILGVHSPVEMYVVDSSGKKTGLYRSSSNVVEVLEEIAGSSYREIGGSKYIILPADIEYEVYINGLSEGGMTFTVHELNGESQTMIIKVPVEIITRNTNITLSHKASDNQLLFTKLLVDINGDGSIDSEISPYGEGDGEFDIDKEETSGRSTGTKITKVIPTSLVLGINTESELSQNERRLYLLLQELSLLLTEWQVKINIEYERS